MSTYIKLMFGIEWKPRALKQLSRIPENDQERIVLSVRDLRNWPDCKEIKKLRGRNDYRLRVGRYRIIFEVSQVVRVIVIEEVKKRDERTY